MFSNGMGFNLAQQMQQWSVGQQQLGALQQQGLQAQALQQQALANNMADVARKLYTKTPEEFSRDSSGSIVQLPILNPKKGKTNMIRDYLNRHKDILFTLVMALLIDHFVLGGALRQRIQKVVEAALERVEKTLGLPATKE